MLKGSGKENYSNIHYVKVTAVELLNFSADKFSFSPFLAVVALANVIRAPVKCVVQCWCRHKTSFPVQLSH